MGREDAAGYAIGAVERAADLLAAMTRLGPSSLTALADASGTTAANAFRILQTLRGRGLAVQDGPRGTWRLGVGWIAIGRAASRAGALEAAAAPAMRALAAFCGESVALAVRDGEQMAVLAVAEGTPGLHPPFAAGERAPLHAGPGRLLLAHAPDAVLRAVLHSRLPRLASATRVHADALAADLPRIRARDWLIAADEVADGIVTVSTPVREAAGEVVGVLSIGASVLRMRAPRPHTLLTPLLEAATAIAAATRL